MKRTMLITLLFLLASTSAAQASNYLLWSMAGVGAVHDIFVDSSGLIYTGSNTKGVYVIDSNASNGPEVIANWNAGGLNGETFGNAREVILVDDVLIVAQREGGTRFIDVSDPAKPTLIATVANPATETVTISKSARMAVEGNMLYVSSVCGGFSRIDITNVRNPQYLDTISFTNSAGSLIESQGISVNGNYAYVATPWAGWSVVDISDLSKMEIINSIAKPVGATPGVWDVHVENGIAYVLAQNYGVEIFNVSDPHNITKISEIVFPAKEGYAGDSPPADIKFLTETIAAISYGSLGVYIYDFTNLALPLLLETLTADEMIAVNMFLSGAILYVAGHTGGLFAFDVSTFLATPLPGALLFSLTGLSALYFKRRKEQRP